VGLGKVGYVTTPANKLTGIYGVSPTDCSPNPVLKLHNYIFQVKKHENRENQHLPLCSFVIVINYRTPRTIKFVVDMNYGCIPPMNWWGLACTILKRVVSISFAVLPSAEICVIPISTFVRLRRKFFKTLRDVLSCLFSIITT